MYLFENWVAGAPQRVKSKRKTNKQKSASNTSLSQGFCFPSSGFSFLYSLAILDICSLGSSLGFSSALLAPLLVRLPPPPASFLSHCPPHPLSSHGWVQYGFFQLPLTVPARISIIKNPFLQPYGWNGHILIFTYIQVKYSYMWIKKNKSVKKKLSQAWQHWERKWCFNPWSQVLET